jgi:hypothetical protein
MSSGTRLANETWEALFRAQATIAGELSAGDVWGELVPREYGVLYALSRAPDLVERVDDPDDGRARRVRLTEEGARAQRRVGTRHGRHVAEAMTRTLSREQLAQLRDLCRALTATHPRSTETSRA